MLDERSCFRIRKGNEDVESFLIDGFAKPSEEARSCESMMDSQKVHHMDGFEKRPQARSANPVCEAYLDVRCNDEGWSTTQHPAFLRSRQSIKSYPTFFNGKGTMLLVIDIGNTNIVMGVYDGDRLINHWRVRTERNMTEDEFHLLATGLFDRAGIATASIERTIISSVVPPMVNILDAFCRRYLHQAPVWVDAKTFTAMPIRYKNPAEVGADRIVNAVAAYERYRCALIVIDFGTATTFDVISEDGAYLGGAISPGIMIAAEALFQKASKLPRVELLHAPESAIGKDTAGSMQSGILFGYAGLVDGMVERLQKELDSKARVIATGGLAPLMAGIARSIESVEPDLTLEGLKLISERL